MLLLLNATLLLCTLAAAVPSAKRGLVFIPNPNWPQDSSIWIQPGSDLTWYYNYGSLPAEEYSHLPQSDFEFVPMMWGAGPNPGADSSFAKSVIKLIRKGINITHVLTFNEPDAPASWGGSNISPENAAHAWAANILSLQRYGIKAGLPAVSGTPGGLAWLLQFVGNCTLLLGRRFTYDFLPVHWYDNFEGLQRHVNEAMVYFPSTKFWVTEYAYAHQDLFLTQHFYNQSAAWFDGLLIVERYSYFGAFRSSVSNVGPAATFLNNAGSLTDIGSWYLGGGWTGVDPRSG